jgi:hypothetical protein
MLKNAAKTNLGRMINIPPLMVHTPSPTYVIVVRPRWVRINWG